MLLRNLLHRFRVKPNPVVVHRAGRDSVDVLIGNRRNEDHLRSRLSVERLRGHSNQPGTELLSEIREALFAGKGLIETVGGEDDVDFFMSQMLILIGKIVRPRLQVRLVSRPSTGSSPQACASETPDEASPQRSRNTATRSSSVFPTKAIPRPRLQLQRQLRRHRQFLLSPRSRPVINPVLRKLRILRRSLLAGRRIFRIVDLRRPWLLLLRFLLSSKRFRDPDVYRLKEKGRTNNSHNKRSGNANRNSARKHQGLQQSGTGEAQACAVVKSTAGGYRA